MDRPRVCTHCQSPVKNSIHCLSPSAHFTDREPGLAGLCISNEHCSAQKSDLERLMFFFRCFLSFFTKICAYNPEILSDINGKQRSIFKPPSLRNVKSLYSAPSFKKNNHLHHIQVLWISFSRQKWRFCSQHCWSMRKLSQCYGNNWNWLQIALK